MLPLQCPPVLLSLGQMAMAAMIEEVDLSPKPGLVDSLNTGAHTDMDRNLFHRSAAAIKPFFDEMVRVTPLDCPASYVLPLLRPIGIRAERAMMNATGGINTHKGQIFSLGVCLAASKRVLIPGRTPPGSGSAILLEAGRICQNLTEELIESPPFREPSHGENVYRNLGRSGIRGEAEAAFPSVRLLTLPLMFRLRSEGMTREEAALEALLHLYTHCEDSTVLHRRGEAGLALMRKESKGFLEEGGIRQPEALPRLETMNSLFISHNISPGGCADLLALTFFILSIIDVEEGSDTFL